MAHTNTHKHTQTHTSPTHSKCPISACWSKTCFIHLHRKHKMQHIEPLEQIHSARGKRTSKQNPDHDVESFNARIKMNVMPTLSISAIIFVDITALSTPPVRYYLRGCAYHTLHSESLPSCQPRIYQKQFFQIIQSRGTKRNGKTLRTTCAGFEPTRPKP